MYVLNLKGCEIIHGTLNKLNFIRIHISRGPMTADPLLGEKKVDN